MSVKHDRSDHNGEDQHPTHPVKGDKEKPGHDLKEHNGGLNPSRDEHMVDIGRGEQTSGRQGQGKGQG